MPLELSQVYMLRRDRRHVVSVGPLADAGCTYLQSSTADVRISGAGLAHILERRPDMTDLEVISMSYGLRQGLLVSERKNRNCLLVSYVHPDTNVRYKIAIKAAAGGQELWVSSFHRMRKRQTRALFDRGEIVQKHK
jgi:hypothetical protein